MKLRVLPILISFIVTLAALLGGWHLYHSYALQNPLSEQLEQLDGVRSAQAEVGNREVQISLELDSDASLREIMHKLKQNGASYIKDRELKLSVTNESSQFLDDWWSSVLFEVAEAMETKKYSEIPVLLQENSSGMELQTSAEMDEEHVYVRLVHQEDVRFIVLPRIPAQLVGWDNE